MNDLQLFGLLDPATEAALRASIRRFGVVVPVTVDQNGRTIDGHHRQRLADELGVECPTRVRPVADEEEAAELALSLNNDRRHLSPEVRRELAADLRSAGFTFAHIGRALGVDTATAHRDLGTFADAKVPDRIIGADGKSRPTKYPPRKPLVDRLIESGDADPDTVEEEVDAILDLAGPEPEAIEAAVEECIESKRLPVSKPDLGGGVSHPARYSDPLFEHFREMLAGYRTVLDPFAGTGRIHELRPDWETTGVELEPEWADLSPFTIVANALALPFAAASFDAVCTSPCLAQQHRLLTDDLRWVPAGDVQAGDRLLAFDESGTSTARGTAARRRWQRTEVVRSIPLTVECVRVILANDDEIITTPNHPWLASRYSYSSAAMQWVQSAALMGAAGVGRGRRGRRQPLFVCLQLRPWAERRDYDAGWLSGLFDGEGSLSMSVHGSPKMQLCQVEGPVLDRAFSLAGAFGYAPNRISRTVVPGRQPVVNLYVTGGFPGMLSALGQLRPRRLLDKWQALDVSSRTVEAERVGVVAVEPAGQVDIQGIETTSGTYIGEGYLHHNTYGNRLADHHNAIDPHLRRSYTHDLGRPLHDDNSGAMHWGADYRAFHLAAWSEAARVLRPGGRFVLNIKDHIRAGAWQDVTAWHLSVLLAMGFTVSHDRAVDTRSLRQGTNSELRVGGEHVIGLDAP